jgi:hypothetical protein
MKLSLLISFLNTLPSDADVFFGGLDTFNIYLVKSKRTPTYVSFDTDTFDHDDFGVTEKSFQAFDSSFISTHIDSSFARKERIDDALKVSKVILKSLEKKDGK